MLTITQAVTQLAESVIAEVFGHIPGAWLPDYDFARARTAPFITMEEVEEDLFARGRPWTRARRLNQPGRS